MRGSAQGVNIGGIPALFNRGLVPGLYYCGTGLGGNTDNGMALTLNLEVAVRFDVAVAQSFDRIGVDVTTAIAVSTVRLGIRNDTGNTYPGAVILDAGTIDSTTTGFKEITIAQTLSPGRYWLTCTNQGAGGVNVRSRITPDSLIGQTSGGAFAACAYSQAGVAGALGAFSAVATIVGNGPKILLRAA